MIELIKRANNMKGCIGKYKFKEALVGMILEGGLVEHVQYLPLALIMLSKRSIVKSLGRKDSSKASLNLS